MSSPTVPSPSPSLSSSVASTAPPAGDPHDQALADADVLRTMADVAAQLMDRHLKRSKTWYPHEHIPWSLGRDFAPGERIEEYQLPEAVRSSLIVNLLTEDNLPYYTLALSSLTGMDDVWGEWIRRWTAEEGRHSTAIRDWLCVTRQVDLIELEDARMAQVQAGFRPTSIPSVPDLFVYLSLQELATRIAHRNTGVLLGDSAGADVMTRVATDENHHFLFYRDLVTAALERIPSVMVPAIERQVRTFEMPGAGMPSFKAHARRIAEAGIYDIPTHHQQILEPVVIRQWRITTIENLSGAAEAARERLMAAMTKIGRIAERMRERRAALEANLPHLGNRLRNA
jgi:acyl-[acyl-carrier-protein] desaturase